MAIDPESPTSLRSRPLHLEPALGAMWPAQQCPASCKCSKTNPVKFRFWLTLTALEMIVNYSLESSGAGLSVLTLGGYCFTLLLLALIFLDLCQERENPGTKPEKARQMKPTTDAPYAATNDTAEESYA